jgi:hypothetical protein
MANCRRAQENYHISGKLPVELEDGSKAFSLLKPPLGSLAARRRAKLIIEDMLGSNTEVLPEYRSIMHLECLPASGALAWTRAVQPPWQRFTCGPTAMSALAISPLTPSAITASSRYRKFGNQ